MPAMAKSRKRLPGSFLRPIKRAAANPLENDSQLGSPLDRAGLRLLLGNCPQRYWNRASGSSQRQRPILQVRVAGSGQYRPPDIA
jgi:hypothetical protein